MFLDRRDDDLENLALWGILADEVGRAPVRRILDGDVSYVTDRRILDVLFLVERLGGSLDP